MTSLSTIAPDPAVIDATRDFQIAVAGALASIRVALEAGIWSPEADQDIEAVCDRISNRIVESGLKPDYSSAAPVSDLLQMALGAMEDGNWSPVSGSDVGAIQSAAFLSDLICSDPELFRD